MVSGNRQQGGFTRPSAARVTHRLPRSRALLAVRAAALLRLCVAFAIVVAVPLCAALCSSFSCSSFAIIYLTSAYALSVFAQEASDGLLKHFVISLYTRWRTAGHSLRSPTGCVCGGSRSARHTHASHLRAEKFRVEKHRIMNPGSGASNVDLSEAERLLKQSTAAPGLPNPAVPPHFMLMHQAVAMQQFQFQQALLLQQMMASQQAQARAATVKSAAEMAAARAAEISKQLKGNDPEGVEEKRSPDRSKSRSASRSRSLSKSRSRSPIRYRRDRSASRSPIRYRRDSRLSPSRSRDFYSYRSRSRRGYYRGRGDYPWNPSFRRDWDRDRDHYGRSSHRSRSRSPVRRRSRSHSHSPRGRRERSATPPRYRRDERRGAGRGSRRSRSRDLKPSPSRSSRSLSESIHGEDVSPRRKSKDSRRGESLSPEPKTGKRALSSSPAQGDQEKLDLEDRGGSKQGNGTAKLSLEHKGRTALSMSPRSLSVSLSPRQRSPEKQSEVDDDKLVMSAANNIAQEAGGRKTEGVTISEKAISNSTLSTWATEARVSPPEGIHEENPGGVRMKEKGKEFVARQGWQLRKESSGKGGDYFDDDSGEDKELDDWRDDMKAHEREKVKRKETKRESVKIEDKKSTAGQTPSIQDQERPAATLHVQTMKSSGKGNEVGSTVSVDLVGGFGVGMKRNIDAGGKELKKKLDIIKLKEVDRDLSDEDPTIEEKIERGVAEVGKRDQKVLCDADGSAGDATKEKTTGSTEDSEVEGEVNVVFEGPKLPHDEGAVLKHTGRLGKSEDSTKELIRKSFKSSRDREDDKEIGALQLELDDEDVLASYKRKEKSRSRERSKRHEDDVDRDRRKDRHRKHRRKHRHRDDETEKEDDDMIEDKADTEGGKEKEERRHHRKHHSRDTNDERRDRKRRKHKHRGKSASESPAPELQFAEAEGGRDDVLSRKKSLSSRDERRGDVLKSLGYSGSGSE